MKNEEYLINDRLDIPNDIKNMTVEELDQEILHLEAEAFAKKENFTKEKRAV